MTGADALVVLITVPSEAEGLDLGRRLVDEHLAACVNVLPGITSIFRWEGHREEASETLLVVKTHTAGYPALERRVLELHPYSVAEVLALPVAAGAQAYLRWVHESIPVEGR